MAFRRCTTEKTQREGKKSNIQRNGSNFKERDAFFFLFFFRETPYANGFSVTSYAAFLATGKYTDVRLTLTCLHFLS